MPLSERGLRRQSVNGCASASAGAIHSRIENVVQPSNAGCRRARTIRTTAARVLQTTGIHDHGRGFTHANLAAPPIGFAAFFIHAAIGVG